jgi:ELWxxDGT repeat protein
VELWRSDGTEAGTFLVKDINPGAGSSTPYNFTVFNNALYFVASDGVSSKLWKTDGTSAGTMALGEAGGTYTTYGLTSMVVFNGFLYFPGVDATNGTELWRTDGTIPGTTLVKDINPGPASSSIIYCINVGDKIVFRATTAAAGAEPWASDGTTGGTVLLQDIEPGTGSSNIERFVVAGNKLFALATTTAHGREVWVANNFVTLPLKFVAFSVRKCINNAACLTWNTSYEQNVSHFDIERSVDAKNYTVVGSKRASNQLQNGYTATDELSAIQGKKIVYYRIKQVDKDGKSALSNIQTLKLDDKLIQVYPTMVGSTLSVVNEGASNASIQFYNADARLVLQYALRKGANHLEVGNLASGMYFYKVITNGQLEIGAGKIVKQ